MGIPRGEHTAKPNLPDLGLRRLLFLKLTPMVRLGNRTYRAWGSKIGRKNRKLNSPEEYKGLS